MISSSASASAHRIRRLTNAISLAKQDRRLIAPPPQAANQQLDTTLSRSNLLKSSFFLAATTLIQPQPSIAAPLSGSPSPLLLSTQTLSKITLSTLSDCQLAVSIYPTFSYNATGGGGTGIVTPRDDGLLDITFDPSTLTIPPIMYSTSAVLGIPIPPPLKISILPEKLQGTIDPTTGETNLDFLARFEFTVASLYKAPPLLVSTVLTSESSTGKLRKGVGERLTANGHAMLVGVAEVPKTGDGFLDSFLILPTDALAVMSAEMKFS